MSKIVELEQALININERIAQETDDNTIGQLMGEKQRIESSIVEARKAEEIEEKVTSEAVPFAVAGVSLDGIPVEVVQLIEEIVRTDRRRIYNEHAIELDQLENELKIYKDNVESSAAEVDSLLDKLNEVLESKEKATEEYGNKIFKLTTELADAESKRDAAVQEKEEILAEANIKIGEMEYELASVKEELNQFIQAKEYQERQTAVITPDETETVTLQQKLEAVKKLYTKTEDWGSVVKVYKPDSSFEVVKRAELESEWSLADVPEIAHVTPPIETFQTEVPEYTIDGEVATEAVGTTETFEEWATREINALKEAVYGNVNKEAA